MNTNKKIALNDVKVGSAVAITGKVNFSKIGKKYEGEELERFNETQRYPKSNPFFRLTLKNITSVRTSDPMLREYIKQRVYVSEKNPDHKSCYTADGIGMLPQIFKLKENGKYTVVDNINELELQQDLDVTIILRAYKSQSYANNGLGFNIIVIEDTKPLEDCFFDSKNGSSNINLMKEFGLIVENDVEINESEETYDTSEIAFPEQPEKNVIEEAFSNEPTENGGSEEGGINYYG